MARKPEDKWKDRLRAKAIANAKFGDEDGQWLLTAWARKNNLFVDFGKPRTDYEQGRQDAILEMLIWAGMDTVKMIEKIKEIENEND